MASLFEDLNLFAKRALVFITGKGATMTAVSLAAPIVGGSLLPAVAIAAGVPITAAMSTMIHHHRETVILNNCRDEIAAQFHISPKDVTHDHLRVLAYGQPELGLEPQPFFQQILKKNDHNRMVEIGANILSALGTITFVALQGKAVVTALTFAGTTAGLAASAPLVAAIGLSLTVGVIMFATNNLLESVGNDLFADKHRSAYEKMEGLERQKCKGLEVTPEQVLDIAAAVHPQIKLDIQQKHGPDALFSMLPIEEKNLLMKLYDPVLHITESSQKINAGMIKVNELAFIAVGERSGIPETLPNIAAQPKRGQGLGEHISQAKEWIRDRYTNANHQQLRSHAAAVGTPPQHQHNRILDTLVEARTPGGTQTFAGDMPYSISFAQRFADADAERKSLSFAERVRLSEQNAQTEERTVH